MVNAGADDAQSHAGEDVSVVALAGMEGLAIKSDGAEGGARRKHGTALSVLVAVLGSALSLG